ncbi:hypothetical protein JCM10212_000504, partial [Sporobolomyces blumeae]
MARGGFDPRPVFSHPFFLITSLVAIAGWWTAFIGQIVLESKFHAQPGAQGSAVGAPWFGIFLQMFINLGVFITLARGTLGSNRFQLSIFLAIAVVMAVIGVNSGIFNTRSFQLAVGAGWLLLAVVDILWLLYLTSEPNTFWPNLFDSGSSISFSSRIASSASSVGTTVRRGGPGSIASRPGGGGGGHHHLGMSHPGGSTAAMSYAGGATSIGGGGGGYQSVHKGPNGPSSVHLTSGPATVSVADLGMGGIDGPGNLLGGGGLHDASQPHLLGDGQGAPEYAVLKARALYS